jgi:hypothetical protein
MIARPAFVKVSFGGFLMKPSASEEFREVSGEKNWSILVRRTAIDLLSDSIVDLNL